MARIVVAQSPHEIPDRPPIRLEVGDRVQVGERDSDWPAFVFVTTQTRLGWVPERHLDREGAMGAMTQAYDTTELPTEVGDELEVLHEDSPSGWLWCRAKSGREGWVPGADRLATGLTSRAQRISGREFEGRRCTG